MENEPPPSFEEPKEEPKKDVPEIPPPAPAEPIRPNPAALFLRDQFWSSFKRKMWYLALGIAVPAAFAVGFFWYWFPFRDARGEIVVLRADMNKLAKKFEELQEENQSLRSQKESIEADRSNILTQAKLLIDEKNRLIEIEEAHKKLTADHEDALKQARRFQSDVVDLKKESQEQNLTIKKISKENRDLRSKLSVFEKDKAEWESKWKGTASKAEQLDRELKKAAPFKAKYESERKRNASLHQQNKKLARELKKAPRRFKDMARENKKLIKETADMHFNLGVFYAKQKLFDRAAAEFKKAVDINPKDAKAHYNLGYIYSEHYHDQKQAEEHFQRYLWADPKDESADWVKNYLLSDRTLNSKVLKS